MKKLANRIVKGKVLIQNAQDFYKQVSPATTVNTIYRRKKDVKISEAEVLTWESPAVYGLMSMHHAAVSKGRVFVRVTSCYQECCLGNTFTPSCESWVETKVLLDAGEEDPVYDSEAEEDEGDGYDTADDIPIADWHVDSDSEEDRDDIPIVQLVPHPHPQPHRLAARIREGITKQKGIRAGKKNPAPPKGGVVKRRSSRK